MENLKMTKEELYKLDGEGILEHIVQTLGNPVNIFNAGKDSTNNSENFENKNFADNINDLKGGMVELVGRLKMIFAGRNLKNDTYYREGKLELLNDSLMNIEYNGKEMHFFPTMTEEGVESFVIGTPNEKNEMTVVYEGIDGIFEAIDNTEFPVGDEIMTVGEALENVKNNKDFPPIYGEESTDLQRVDIKKTTIQEKIRSRVDKNDVQGIIDSFIPCLEDDANYGQMIEHNNVFKEINDFNKEYRADNIGYYHTENKELMKLLIEHIPELSNIDIQDNGNMAGKDRELIKTVLESHGTEVDGKKIDLSDSIIKVVEGIQEIYANDILENNEEVNDRLVSSTLKVKISPDFYKYMGNSVVLEEVLSRNTLTIEDKVDKFNKYIEEVNNIDTDEQTSKLSEKERVEVLETKMKLGIDKNEFDSKNPPVNEKNISDFKNSLYGDKNIISNIREMYPTDTNALTDKVKNMPDGNILRDFAEIFGENEHNGIDSNQSVFVAKAKLFMLNDVNGPAVSMMQTAMNSFLPSSMKLQDKYINKPEKVAGLIEKNLSTITKNKTASNLAYALNFIGNPGDNYQKHKWYSEGIGGRKGSVIDGISKGFGAVTRSASKSMTPPHNGDDVSAKFDSMYINNMFDLQSSTNAGASLKLDHLLGQNIETSFKGADTPAFTYLKHYEGMKRSMGLGALQPARMKLKAILEKTKKGEKLSAKDGELDFMNTIDPTFMQEEGESDANIEYGEDSVQSMFQRFNDPSDAANQNSSSNGNRQREFLSKYKKKYKGKDDIILKELELLQSAIDEVKNNLDNIKEEKNVIVSAQGMDETEEEILTGDINKEHDEKVIKDDIDKEHDEKVTKDDIVEEHEIDIKSGENMDEIDDIIIEADDISEIEEEVLALPAPEETLLLEAPKVEEEVLALPAPEETLLIEAPKVEEEVLALPAPEETLLLEAPKVEEAKFVAPDNDDSSFRETFKNANRRLKSKKGKKSTNTNKK
jgi:hypothetical protein